MRAYTKGVMLRNANKAKLGVSNKYPVYFFFSTAVSLLFSDD